jgi:hypothetical protein
MISLSFDTDHVDEGRMAEFLDLVPIPGRATFFCTTRYGALEATSHELNPHAFLPAGGEWEAELESKRRLFPDAVGWRSHSCVFSHMLAERLAALGYRYASTHDEPGRLDTTPYRQAWGLWQVPIYYMDNLDFSAQRFWGKALRPFDPNLIDRAVSGSGVYVFAFHPVHLLLNSPDAETYLRLRDDWTHGRPLESLRHRGYGTMSFYDELVSAMAETHTASVPLMDAVEAYAAAEPATAR